MANKVQTPVQNYFEKVLYENLTFEIPPLWFLSVVSRGIKKIVTSRCGQIRNTFFVHFSWRCKQNVMNTNLNYHNYWGNYTWLSIYISKIKISWKLWTNILFFLHFSVFFMKNVWGYPYLKTHMIKKSFYWK